MKALRNSRVVRLAGSVLAVVMLGGLAAGCMAPAPAPTGPPSATCTVTVAHGAAADQVTVTGHVVNVADGTLLYVDFDAATYRLGEFGDIPVVAGGFTITKPFSVPSPLARVVVAIETGPGICSVPVS